MKKKITLGSAARTELCRGAETLASVLRPGFGPQGRTALLSSHASAPDCALKSTSIAKELQLKDVTENAGVILLRSVAEKMNDSYGDGARLGALIAQSILRDGLRLLSAGFSPVPLRRGIEKALPVAVRSLRRMTRRPDARQLAAAAALAARDEALGGLVAEAAARAGADGFISAKPSDTDRSYLEEETAFCIEGGWGSKYMATDEVSQETLFEDAAVFVCAAAINSIYDILPLLDEVSVQKTPLLVIADSIHENVIRSFVSNISQGTIRICSVEVPGVGQARRAWLEDAAAKTGTVVFGLELYPDPKQASLAACGRALRVRVTRTQCRIETPPLPAPGLEEYLRHLHALLRQDLNELEAELLRKRIANLNGRGVVLRIGALTETERRFLSAQAEGAIKCAFSAASKGVLPGGGAAYIRAIPAVREFSRSLPEEERLGAEMLMRALEAPLKQIAANAGFVPEEVLAEVSRRGGDWGFDALNGTCADMAEAGILDSAPAVTAALETGAGMAAQLLTVDAAVLIDGVPLSDLPVPDDLHLTPGDFV